MNKHYFNMPSLERTIFDDKLNLHRIVGKEMAIVYAEFEKGAEHLNLIHSNEEFFYVLKGRFKAQLNGENYTLKNGDALLIPSNLKHSFLAEETSMALISFAPPISAEEADKLLEMTKDHS